MGKTDGLEQQDATVWPSAGQSLDAQSCRTADGCSLQGTADSDTNVMVDAQGWAEGQSCS
jgi:hypothetical protein